MNCEHQIIEWIDPNPNESIESYAKRLIPQIDVNTEFGLLGVSFGGLISIELGKQINPQKIILISSVETSNQLSSRYLKIGKSGILNLIPNSLIKPPNFLLGYLFGATDKQLLQEIIKDESTPKTPQH